MRKCIAFFYIFLFVAVTSYRYRFSESEAFATSLLFLGFLLLYQTRFRNLEKFGGLEYSEPLEFRRNRVYNPTGWRWTNETTIKTTVDFYADKGECDYANLMARPQLGFPSKSDGFGYTTWNDLQGTNAWFAWNEGTGGSGWFWWKPSDHWQSLPDKTKRKFLQLELMVTSEGETPSFPTGYSVTCPDYNFSRSVRLWVEFSYNPMLRIHKYNSKDKIKDKEPPLIISNPTVILPANKLVVLNQFIAEGSVIIKAQQGKIGKVFMSDQKDNDWFSWSVNKSNNSQIDLKITVNSQQKPPDHFPARYTIKIKDAERERYVKVVIVLVKNPFSISIAPDTKQKICPDSIRTRSEEMRCRCALPLLLRQLCPRSHNNQ